MDPWTSLHALRLPTSCCRVGMFVAFARARFSARSHRTPGRKLLLFALGHRRSPVPHRLLVVTHDVTRWFCSRRHNHLFPSESADSDACELSRCCRWSTGKDLDGDNYPENPEDWNASEIPDRSLEHRWKNLQHREGRGDGLWKLWNQIASG